MNKAAIYHRPESEYAYLYTANELRYASEQQKMIFNQLASLLRSL